MGDHRRYWILGLGLASVCLPGCSEELGPAVRKTARVSGVVRRGPAPVRGGWIEFCPIDGTVGNLRSAPIAPDGTFTADGVAVGRNLVGLAGVPGLDHGERRFFDTLSSPIRRTIPPSPSAPLDVDLIQEVVRARSGSPDS
jgi:hypothetical protein